MSSVTSMTGTTVRLKSAPSTSGAPPSVIEITGGTLSRVIVSEICSLLPAWSVAASWKTFSPATRVSGPALKLVPVRVAGAPSTVTSTASSTSPVMVISGVPTIEPSAGVTARNCGGVVSISKLTPAVALLPASSVAVTASV